MPVSFHCMAFSYQLARPSFGMGGSIPLELDNSNQPQTGLYG
jgi:hypothetical protein